MSIWNKILRRTSRERGRVVAHILDPITGYSNRELKVGADVDLGTVRRLGESEEVFVLVSYDGGVPVATFCTRAHWLRAQENQEALGQGADASVWRPRQELDIGLR